MHTAPARNFSVEVHPPGWRFPAGKTWIAGWIQPAQGQLITDVRARIQDRVILGLGGLPHPAFPENPPGQPHVVGAGFSFLLAPQRGATLLRLEARNQSGHWTEFFRTPISAAADAIVHQPAPDLSSALGPLTTAFLRQRLYTPHRSRREMADELVAAFVSEPLDAHPNPPFVGALEEPHTFGRLRYGLVPVTGWLAHPTAKITRLSLIIDPLPVIDLPHGFARHDVASAFPALDGHENSAFVGEVALPMGLVAPVLLKIFSDLDNGEKHLVFARRFTPQLHGDSGDMPHLISRTDFIRAVWALHGAAGRHGLARRGMFTAARKIWAGYHARPAYGPPTLRSHSNRTPAAARLHPSTEPGLTLIDPADGMQVPDRAQYFVEGRDALALVQAAVAQAGTTTVNSILDLPCGFGRVGRWFRTAYPAAKLAACDTQLPGVEFCIEHLGAEGVQAELDGSHWTKLPGPYDIIWCGSLLTHFDRDQWVNHLHRFHERLTAHGVLVFTSHGLLSLEHLRSGEKNYGLSPAAVTHLREATVAAGFGYADYDDTPGYGISVAQPGWIRELVERETDLRVLAIHEAAWGQHQDVVVCVRRDSKEKSWWQKLTD